MKKQKRFSKISDLKELARVITQITQREKD